MAADPRLTALLAEKQVGCTLRKQPKPLTHFFYLRLKDYSLLSERPDRADQPVSGLLDRLYTFLKFVGKPNDVWRKEALVRDQWPALRADLVPLLPYVAEEPLCVR